MKSVNTLISILFCISICMFSFACTFTLAAHSFSQRKKRQEEVCTKPLLGKLSHLITYNRFTPSKTLVPMRYIPCFRVELYDTSITLAFSRGAYKFPYSLGDTVLLLVNPANIEEFYIPSYRRLGDLYRKTLIAASVLWCVFAIFLLLTALVYTLCI